MHVAMGRRKGKRAIACQDGNKGETKRLLTDLPTGIVTDILSWLPLKSLFNCRYVCKTWLQIISDPHFAKLHLSRSSMNILIQNERPRSESRNLLLYQIEKAPHSDRIRIEEMMFTPRLNLPNSSFEFFNSCNGLLCLCGIKEKLVHVCNPVLGEFITIKVPDEDMRTSKSLCFGFSVKTNEAGPKAEVYTIGAGSWKSLGHVLFEIGTKRFNTYLRGAFHWVEYSVDQIACFDFEEELFREVPAPPQFQPEPFDCLILGVIEDCLCACCYRDDGSYRFEIWVMKDYGVKESWTTPFRIKHTFLSDSHCDIYYPLILINGKILMSYNDETVVCYNMKRKRFREIGIYAKRDYFNLIAYTACFVSLKDVAKGEQISRYETCHLSM